MVDKDLKEIDAIEYAFPSMRVLLCFVHNSKTFIRKLPGALSSIANQMMLAETEEEFKVELEKFKADATKEHMEYMTDNWLNCIPMWAKYKRFGKFDPGLDNLFIFYYILLFYKA